MADRNKIIDPSSISFETIKNDLNSYIKKKEPENAWLSFLESGPGQILVELIAGLGHLLNIHSVSLKRETGIQTATNLASVSNLVLNLDYPINRISAPRIEMDLRVNPGLGPVFLEKELPVAIIENRNVSLLESQTVDGSLSDSITVSCVVGDWNSYTYTSDKDYLFGKIFIEGLNIDNDSLTKSAEEGIGADFTKASNITNKLFINRDTVLDPDDHTMILTRFAEDFIYGDDLNKKVIIKTHPEGVVLIFGNGVVGRKLSQGDVLDFEYITSIGPLQSVSLTPLSFSINTQLPTPDPDSDFEILDARILSPGYLSDSIDKLKAISSGYFSSKRRMVTKDDHEFILQSYPGIISSKVNPVTIEGSCCRLDMAYLFSDEHKATENEKESIMNYLEDYRLLGSLLTLVDPKKIGVIYTLTILISENTDVTDVKTQISQILKKYTLKLGETIHPGEIYRDISRIEGIRRIYPQSPIDDKILAYDEYFKLEKTLLTIITNPSEVVQLSSTNQAYITVFSQVENYVYNNLVYAPDDTITESRRGVSARLIVPNFTGPFNEGSWDFGDLEFWKSGRSYPIGKRVYAPSGSSIQGKVIESMSTHVSSTNFSSDYAQTSPILWVLKETGV